MTTGSKSSNDSARAVLDGVPYVGFDLYQKLGKIEGCPFPSCLRSCMEYLGEPYAYEYILFASGAAFRLVWNPGKWDGASIDVILMAEDSLQPFLRAFEAIGYGCEILGNADLAHKADEGIRFFKQYEGHDVFRERIVTSIRDRGRPVLALGVVGPPECCIVAGYDEGGDVLVGWSFFQGMTEMVGEIETEPPGYFRQGDWFKQTPGLILVGGKQEAAARKEIHRRALEWALKVVRTPEVHGRCGGLAAYEAWAQDMQRDEDFPADDLGVLYERHMCHNDAISMMAEGRWYASVYLAQIAHDEPGMAADLLAAASCYAVEHDIAWKIWGLVGGLGWEEEKVRKLAEPGVRRGISKLILQAREKDAEAADYIERALAK